MRSFLSGLSVFHRTLLAAALSLAAGFAHADIQQQIDAAERMAGKDPKASMAMLEGLAGDAHARHANDDLRRVETARCWLLSYTEPAKALALANAMLGQARLQNDPSLHVCRGYAYEQLQRDEEAMAEYDFGIEQGGRVHDQPARSRALALRGEQRHLRGLYAGAIDDLKAAYELEQHLGNAENQRYVLNALGNLYADNNVQDFENALEAFGKLLAFHEAAGDLRGQATMHFNLGSTYENQGKLAPARRHFEQALAFERRRAGSGPVAGPVPDDVAADIANDQRAYAVVLSKLGEHAQAIALLDSALASLQSRAEPDAAALAALHLSRGAVYRRAGRFADALAELEAALRHFEPQHNARYLQKIHEERAATYAQAGDWRNAYRAQQAMIEAQQALQKHMLDERATRLRVQFQSEQAKLRNTELQHQNALQQRDLENTAQVRRWQLAALAASFGLIALLSAWILRQRRLSRRMRDLALTDELTRLPNRRHFMTVAAQAFEQAHRSGAQLSLAAIDIDHFKRINDRHGHATGDIVLQRVAHALRSALRPGDMVGRTGGEEFLCLLRGASKDDALSAGERLREAVMAIDCGDLPDGVVPSISIGVAGSQPQDATLDLLCRRADHALYRAKENGRNRVELAAA
jgi:diguanylate cyclase (GGDEF)-like protein